jgi:hypothetical protein
MTNFTCKDCIHAGEPHLFGDREVVECRCAAVTISGFPIVSTDAWCTPGKNDSPRAETNEDELPEGEDQVDASEYITRNNGDGSVTTLHVPTTIMQLHDKVKILEQEVEFNKRGSLWHLIRHW